MIWSRKSVLPFRSYVQSMFLPIGINLAIEAPHYKDFILFASVGQKLRISAILLKIDIFSQIYS